MQVHGEHACGYLRGKRVAYLLVRISPFNTQVRRQTCVAGGNALPVLDETALLAVYVTDIYLYVSTIRVGGSGGPKVNEV